MVKSTMQNLRARVQKSGKTFYYFDTGGKPRKEIPLGSDYVLAVRKWAELSSAPAQGVPAANFIELIERYELEELHKLASPRKPRHAATSNTCASSLASLPRHRLTRSNPVIFKSCWTGKPVSPRRRTGSSVCFRCCSTKRAAGAIPKP